MEWLQDYWNTCNMNKETTIRITTTRLRKQQRSNKCVKMIEINISQKSCFLFFKKKLLNFYDVLETTG